jgi:serralysin
MMRAIAGSIALALAGMASAAPAPVSGILELSPPKPLLSSPGHSTPEVGRRPDGGFVAAWYRDTDGNIDIVARVFDAAGAPLTNAIDVNQTTAGTQLATAVGVDGDGNFVVAWADQQRDAIYARRFSAAGAALADEFKVNPEPAAGGLYNDASVAMAPDGRFVIAWSKATVQAYARVYDAGGNAVGDVVTVTPTGAQAVPQAAMHSDGSFVVAFSSSNGGGDGSQDIFVRGFDANGAERFPRTQVNLDVDGDKDMEHPHFRPSLAMQADGAFQVAWTRSASGPDIDDEVYLRRFTAGGAAREEAILMSAPGQTNGAFGASVGVDALGATTVVWSDLNGTSLRGRSLDRYARFDGDPYTITDTQADITPRGVAFDADGEFVVVWYGKVDGLDAILGRFYEAPYEGPPPDDGSGGDDELGDTRAGGAVSLGLLLVLGGAVLRRRRR